VSLSLCMIVKNEEENLRRCLDSVKDIVDEMIIVDTGSTDSTVEIAESFGAKIYHFQWNDNFSDARNYSLKFPTCDWILFMDGDDELEKSDQQSILKLVEKNEADAYFFQTICYTGDEPGLEGLNNLNIRLLKNHMGYYFSNPIHEQIYSNIQAINPSAKILNETVKVYHYGYLNKNVIAQEKRKRNIRILEKELEQSPGYGFTLFNLGNEYFAMGNFSKALEYYVNSYSKFQPEHGYSSKLVLKMANCLISLGRYEHAFMLIDDGLKFYPKFTDLLHLKALGYFWLQKFTLAIKYLNECIQMGEAPFYQNMIIGAGDYRSYLLLGEIYYYMEDYDCAIESYSAALKYNKAPIPALYKLIKTLCIKKTSPSTLAKKLEEIKKYCPDKFHSIVYDVLFQEKYYKSALSYIKQLELASGVTTQTVYYKALCKIFLKQFNSAYKILEAIKHDPEYQTRVICSQALCRTLKKEYSKASALLLGENVPLNDVMINVYMQFNNLMELGNPRALSEDEESSVKYTAVIFDLLKILIRQKEFEVFERALGLLNCVSDKTVLLKLAKLYYEEDHFGLACQEFMRSIKEFDLIDTEGANMLHKLKCKGF
jgi:glycosyltransferase involved in cell wall biosynthesis